MRYETFGGSSPDGRGILMANHIASSLSDATGDRAEHLVDRFGMPVLAYERPSTAELPQLPAFSPEGYVDDVARRALELQEVLESMGVKRAILLGNSAAALEELAVAASGNVAIEHVVAVEPVGLMEVPKNMGIAKWAAAQLKQNKAGVACLDAEDLAPLGNIRETATPVTLARRIHKEVKAYGDVYRSNVGRSLITCILREQPGLPVDITLADNSFANTPEVRESLMDETAGSSIKVEVLPDATHSFTDRHHYVLHLLEKALQ